MPSKDMLETLDSVRQQLETSYDGIAELSLRHHEWQRSIEQMIRRFENTISMPAFNVLSEEAKINGELEEDEGAESKYKNATKIATNKIFPLTQLPCFLIVPLLGPRVKTNR